MPNDGTLQIAPRGRTIWPSVSESSNPLPSIFGASQRLCVRAQSQTHAASGFVGSTSLGFHSCQPHEKTEPRWSSAATLFAESASHFTTWYHAEAGWSPLRPPTPFWLRKLSMMPSLFAGRPIDVKSVTAAR